MSDKPLPWERLRNGDPTVTIGDKYGPAMTMKRGATYFKACVRHTLKLRPELTLAEAESIERQNLGYYAGYYDQATQERVQRVFNCEHPIFGKASNEVTRERAMRLGAALAGKR